jgi:hypothetical protein
MFIGSGVVLGIKTLENSFHFCFLITINSLWNQNLSVKPTAVEEINTIAKKIGKIATYLQNKLNKA